MGILLTFLNIIFMILVDAYYSLVVYSQVKKQ